MLWLALLTAFQAAPYTTTSPSTQELYRPPAVRPFEPPSSFGRATAEGDGAAGLHRPPLETPVTVEAYVHSYEWERTDIEIAYDQGVTQAEMNADARMGPLDGEWRVVDAGGRELMALVLSDHGDAKPVEGAWRGYGSGGPDGVGFLARVERGDRTASLTLDQGDVILVLERSATGAFTGVMKSDGQETPVRLKRR